MMCSTGRARAAEVVEHIADTLADRMAVIGVTDAVDNLMTLPGGVRQSPWKPVTLSDGNPAIALLYAELGAVSPEHRKTAHDYLAAALAAPASESNLGLYTGIGSLSFAANAAALGYGGYTTLLDQLDATVASIASWRASGDLRRVRAGEAIGSWSYDVISGFSGIGRHLLTRHEVGGDPAVRSALTDVLSVLVAIATAGDVAVGGEKVPAWWVRHGTTKASFQESEHLNLGLAHGVAGPLALLALAWRAGVRVEAHEEAMCRIVELLGRCQVMDDAGPFWPYWVSLGQVTGTESIPVRRSRDVWCYGAVGVARALYLAGTAIGNAEWENLAHRAFEGALALDGRAVADYSLCHGWAGLLHVVNSMARDSRRKAYIEAAEKIAGRISDAYDGDKPFGYHFTHPTATLGENRPGFLEGTAGIALALHCYATDQRPRTRWDSALLVN